MVYNVIKQASKIHMERWVVITWWNGYYFNLTCRQEWFGEDYGVSMFIHVEMWDEGELHEYYKSITLLLLEFMYNHFGFRNWLVWNERFF